MPSRQKSAKEKSVSSKPIVITNETKIDPVSEGSVWEWQTFVLARTGHVFKKGERAEIIEKTGMTPFGEIMERGYNLLVHTSNGTTVWSSFEQCVSRGLLKRIR